MAKITRFEVHHLLHPGLSDSGRLKPVPFPATVAGLALAEDWAGYYAIDNRGAYGSATARVYVVVEDDGSETAIPATDIPPEALASLPVGTLRIKDWRGMDRTVWDGHNHVKFNPHRAKALWARIQFAP